MLIKKKSVYMYVSICENIYIDQTIDRNMIS